MKIKTILLGAALAATIPMKAAQSYFVIFDSLLRVPALCYPLPPGWTGMGWVKWNVPARSNPYLQSTILMNPSERRIVQEAGFIGRGAFLLSQSGGIYSNPDAMAQHLAREINSGIVVPGLSSFRAKGGRFSDKIPPNTQVVTCYLSIPYYKDGLLTTAKVRNNLNIYSKALFAIRQFTDCIGLTPEKGKASLDLEKMDGLSGVCAITTVETKKGNEMNNVSVFYAPSKAPVVTANDEAWAKKDDFLAMDGGENPFDEPAFN